MTSARGRRSTVNPSGGSSTRGGMFSSSSSGGSNNNETSSSSANKMSKSATTSPASRTAKKGSLSMVAKPQVQILGVPKIIKPPSQQQPQQQSTPSSNEVSANVVVTSIKAAPSTSITTTTVPSTLHPSSPSRSTVTASPPPPSTPPAPATSSSSSLSTNSSYEGFNSPPDRVQSPNNLSTKQLLKRGGSGGMTSGGSSSPVVPTTKSARANISNRLSPVSPQILPPPPLSSSSSSSSSASASPLPTQTVVKFMNSHWEILTDRVSKLLNTKSEATAGLLANEFYVVGVFGGRATGKSTLGNILAGGMLEQPFEVCGIHEIIQCERKTRGLDLYITNDRVLILDCEALFADSTESEPEMTSLHLGLFLYSICHVLIIPHIDSYPDSHLIRYVRTLENLKKGIPDQFNKASPKIIFVANDQQADALSRVPSALSSIHGFDTFVMKHDPDEQTKHLFRECVFRGVERRFRGGEKDWLNACGKNWELIRKNYFFGEYIRTVQRIYISS